MQPCVSDFVRILMLLVLAVSEAVYLLMYYKHPISLSVVIVSAEIVLLATPLLWLGWLRKRGIFFYTLLAIGFLGAAVADWMKNQPLSAFAFAGVFLYGAIGIARKLVRYKERLGQSQHALRANMDR